MTKYLSNVGNDNDNHEAKRTDEGGARGSEGKRRWQRDREKEEKKEDNKHVRAGNPKQAESRIIDEALLGISPRPAPSLCEPDPWQAVRQTPELDSPKQKGPVQSPQCRLSKSTIHKVSDFHNKILAQLQENWPHPSRARQQSRC